jgi:hypothetical protein
LKLTTATYMLLIILTAEANIRTRTNFYIFLIFFSTFLLIFFNSDRNLMENPIIIEAELVEAEILETHRNS